MRVIFLFALLGSALAVPRNIVRIVGGSPTTVEAYPFVANLQHLVWGIWWQQYCGGALLTPTTILSAAHCFYGDTPNQWRVRLGTSSASSGGVLHDVFQLVLHQQYHPTTLNNDVAIVRLAVPAAYSNSIQAARIAGANYNLADGTSVTVVGWGDLQYQGPAPDQLQHVSVNIINQELCAERYAYLKTQPGFSHWPNITNGMLCTGILDVGGKDACQGDSGGPVVHGTDIVVGVVSWGFECADAFYPGINARVSSYTDWILANA